MQRRAAAVSSSTCCFDSVQLHALSLRNSSPFHAEGSCTGVYVFMIERAWE
jgi:hypothetical protein